MVLARERYDRNDILPEQNDHSGQPGKVRRIKSSTKIGYSVVIAFIMALALLIAVRHSQIASVGYELIDLKKQIQNIAIENQELQSKIDQLNSLDNIEYIATVKLGMQKPELAEGVQFIPVEYSKAGLKAAGGTASNVLTVPNATPKQEKNFLVQALASIINT